MYDDDDGNRIMADMSATLWDATSQVSSQLVHCYIYRRVMVFPIFSNMAAVCHFELKKNNLWSCDCHCGPNVLLCTKLHQNWFTRSPPDAITASWRTCREDDGMWPPNSSVGTYLSGTARAVPLLKVGRLVMHFAVPLFGHRLHIALQVYMSNDHAACKFPHLLYQEAFSLHCLIYTKFG